MLPHMRQRGETMTSDSAGHIILIPTQPVGSGRPQRESNPGPPVSTELPRPPVIVVVVVVVVVVLVIVVVVVVE